MNKKELLAMPILPATPQMMKLAAEDKPENRSGYRYGQKTFLRTMYLRCGLQDNILQVSLFMPQYMRAGSLQPLYRVFIDAGNRKFLTYDTSNQKWLTAKVDRLPEISYIWGADRAWSTESENTILQRYLGNQKDGYYSILDFQEDIRAEELKRRHRRETAPWDKDMEQVPLLPKDWERWVDKVALPEQFVFYDYKKGGAKQGYCTYCERDVPIHVKPRHNQEGRCTRCHRKIKFKAIGRTGRFYTDEHCFYLIQRCRDGVVIREFWGNRYCDKDFYRTRNIRPKEYQRLIFDIHKPETEIRSYYWGDYKNTGHRWIAGDSPTCYGYFCYNYHIGDEARIYGKTLPDLARRELRMTGLVDWVQKHKMVANPKRYLRLWRAAPQFEQIWKAGLTQLTKEFYGRDYHIEKYIMEPQQSRLVRALGLEPKQFHRLQIANGGCKYLGWLQFEKATKRPVTNEMLAWFRAHKIEAHDLQFIQNHMNATQIYNYLCRQQRETGMEIRQVLTTWQDYLSMAEKLGIDTSDEIIYRARLLRQRHDELVLRMQEGSCEEAAAKVLKTFPDVDKICRSLKGKYEYANEEFTVVAPDGAKDIIAEGRMLSHCSGKIDRYWDRIQQKESFVLFLRRAEFPHLPYYTLEVEPDGTIRQKRTKFDRQEDDIELAIQFLLEWQKVIARRLTETDKALSRKSRILREQEFVQLQKDRVIIHTGDLAGQSLAAVLMADLMENAA